MFKQNMHTSNSYTIELSREYYCQTFNQSSKLSNEKQICLTQICNNMYDCNFLGVKFVTPHELFCCCLRDTNHQCVEIT